MPAELVPATGGGVLAPPQPAACVAPGRPTERWVRLVLWSENADARSVADTISELLANAPVCVSLEPSRQVRLRDVLEPGGDAPPAFARLFVARRPRQLELFLVDQGWERVLVRALELPAEGVDVVIREQVGQIVLTTIEALLAGRPIGRARDEIRREQAPEPVVPTVPEPEDTFLVHAEARYGLRLQGGGLPLAHEVGAVGRFVLGSSALRPFGFVNATLAVSPDLVTEELELSLFALRAAAGVGAIGSIGPIARWFASVGGGVEATRAEVATLGDRPLLQARAPSWRPRPVGVVTVGFDLHLFDAFGLALGLDLVTEFDDRRYVVEEDSIARVVANPWTLRPGLWVTAGALF